MTRVCDVTNAYGCGWQQTVHLLFDKYISLFLLEWAEPIARPSCARTAHTITESTATAAATNFFVVPQAFCCRFHSGADEVSSFHSKKHAGGLRFTVPARACVSVHVRYVDTWYLIDGNNEAKNYINTYLHEENGIREHGRLGAGDRRWADLFNLFVAVIVVHTPSKPTKSRQT